MGQILKNKGSISRAFLLTLVSFLSLYFELVLIRWIPGQVRVVNYFTNLVLIANFLGLGLGCASPGRTQGNEARFLVRLFLLVAVCLGIRELGFLPSGEFWGESYFGLTHLGLVPIFLWAILVFLGTALVQVPLGRVLGRELENFPPLFAYSLNLFGSVLGVLALALFNSVSLGPFWWFALGIILYLPLLLSLRTTKFFRFKIIPFLSGLLTLILVWRAQGEEIWSPYYKIKLERFFTVKILARTVSLPLGDAGYSLTINDNFFQFSLNLSPQYLRTIAGEDSERRVLLERIYDFYQLPYLLKKPEKVLILGAGTGNDVAQALRNGVERIDAVEIDPVIAGLGFDHHPERPYQDPRVSLFIDDARHYLKSTDEQYDLIIYGLLDSQRLVSYLSIVRQDNFVYTYEGLRDASLRLKPEGMMVIAHVSKTGSPQSLRLFQMLQKIFPGKVSALQATETALGLEPWNVFIAGPQVNSQTKKELPEMKEVTLDYLSFPQVRLPTDNWPFLYLQTQAFWKTDYFKTLVLLVLIALLLIRRTLPEMKQIQPHFLLLGAGFLLLETKSIIQMSIFFGSTWVVNSVVITAFLLMALLANILVYLFKPKRIYPFYLLLLLSLLFNLSFPLSHLASASLWVRIFLGGGMMALPVLFSGVIFAQSFQKVKSPATALGSNIMGALFGGFSEYSSLFLGYNFLYLIAILFYLGAWLFSQRE